MMNPWLAIFIGGGIGSICRYAISLWLPSPAGSFPFATLLANVLSCIVLGWAFIFFSRQLNLHDSYRLLILTGFCGGFSTFSTFSLEAFNLIHTGNPKLALGYMLSSMISCLLIFYLIFFLYKSEV